MANGEGHDLFGLWARDKKEKVEGGCFVSRGRGDAKDPDPQHGCRFDRLPQVGDKFHFVYNFGHLGVIQLWDLAGRTSNAIAAFLASKSSRYRVARYTLK